nr:YggS family pyridoxal phosphate-dependent enzyme [Agromyces seonyuensis]
MAAVRAGIADAAAAASRRPEELTLIAVTKFHPASLVRDLVALGVHDVGENRHQEAQAKAAELEGLPITWHFIGQLQSKKARQVARYADVIHSIDRAGLVDALAGQERVVDALIQVDLSGEPGRGGVAPEELDALVEHVLATPSLRLRGLMAVAPLGGLPRPAFARVRDLSERVVLPAAPGATWLSIGMSHDYPDAIAEGATHLRIGTAITGNRPDAG